MTVRIAHVTVNTISATRMTANTTARIAIVATRIMKIITGRNVVRTVDGRETARGRASGSGTVKRTACGSTPCVTAGAIVIGVAAPITIPIATIHLGYIPVIVTPTEDTMSDAVAVRVTNYVYLVIFFYLDSRCD